MMQPQQIKSLLLVLWKDSMHVHLLQPQQTQMQLQQMKSPLLAAVVVERHVHTAAATADADPCCLLLWWWKDTSILLQPQQTQMQLEQMESPLLAAMVLLVHTDAATAEADAVTARPYCWWCKYTLDVYTAGCGRTPCTSILLLPYW